MIDSIIILSRNSPFLSIQLNNKFSKNKIKYRFLLLLNLRISDIK